MTHKLLFRYNANMTTKGLGLGLGLELRLGLCLELGLGLGLGLWLGLGLEIGSAKEDVLPKCYDKLYFYISKISKYKQYNNQKKKPTVSDVQNTTRKTKVRATRTLLKTGGASPHMASVVLLVLQTR